MLDFKLSHDKKTGNVVLKTSISGKHLLTTPQLNKGTAFSQEERHAFGLLGKLPNRIETLDEQVQRAYLQYANYKSKIKQNTYLNSLHDENQVLFYKLLSQHLNEMLPTIYTPIVGSAVKSFSRDFRHPRGIYISHTDQDNLDEILNNRSNPEIDLIVVTDGEGVLGIGDQGIGGMDIPVAKLMVYSLCGGIDPTRTLPIFLDVGTNNQELLHDPLYLGCRHPRIDTPQYDAFIENFVAAIQRHFPRAFLHWEDLGRHNARRILHRYQDSLCTFNDDIQGTGAVTLAALLAASDITGHPLTAQRIVVFGAGSAGTGISDQIVDALIQSGLSKQDAYKRFWLIDRQGLLLNDDITLTDAQIPYARSREEVLPWKTHSAYPTLRETVHAVKPTILIGCSAQPGAFTQEIIETMSAHCEHPIIFPLSNPDDKCEAIPEDILSWSKGKALIATGTAFPSVTFKGRVIEIPQCNNALVFPGLGLGIRAVHAKRLTKNMMWAASSTLRALSPARKNKNLPLLPSLGAAQEVAKAIALAVARTAIDEGLADTVPEDDLKNTIDKLFWEPIYLPYQLMR